MKLKNRVEELEYLVGEAYQIVGELVCDFDLGNNTKLIKHLDNLAAQKIIHKDVLDT